MNNLNVKVWLGDIDAVETDYPIYFSCLDPIERSQASQFKNDLLRLRYAAIHAKLRDILAEAVDSAPELLRIHRTPYGKPYLPDFPDISFNMSHTENKAAIAVGYRCQLGIDIETCKPRTNLAGLANKCFGEEEKRYWQLLPETLNLLEFYRLWTRKEAFVKATGRGIALGLSDCVIHPHRQSEFLRIPADFGLPSAWQIHDITEQNVPELVGALVVNSTAKCLVERSRF